MISKRGEGKRSSKKTFGRILADNYIKSWKFIKESRNFIFIITGIFFAFALIGFFVPVPDQAREQLLKYIQEIVAQTSGLSPAELIAFIFFNNAKSSFFGLALGILLGVFPVVVSLFNGYLLGFVAQLSVKSDGVLILWRLLPHGIFELPAVFISLGMGMKLGAALIKDRKKFKGNFYDSMRVFLTVVIPLLIIAAIIEGSLIALIK